ncbi:hypothetical protein AYO20_06356 [Fonsecaea nubica]|uniref:Cyclin-like domain-containing protein n=1 Tax=Fonsecaea nubica TaxID=856822 RepID=A0A178CYW1_9EURO|nr:hypothetical protein AYO20_06356 [Fonsecaea nubica]OAL34303.1 hypothetical protein AYO20_06356 [Fonsecaea nubica]
MTKEDDIKGLYWIPESPRWLVMKDRSDDAKRILLRLHANPDDPDNTFANTEFYQIHEQIALDRQRDSSWWHLFRKPSYRKRCLIAMGTTAIIECCGGLVINNYRPILYVDLGFSHTKQLLYPAAWLTFATGMNAVGVFIVDFFPPNRPQRTMPLLRYVAPLSYTRSVTLPYTLLRVDRLNMIEDDEYRASSQYRYWSYTEEKLAQIRQRTNRLASERVKAAIRKTGVPISGSSENNENTSADPAPGVPTLAAQEELKIVEWACTKIFDMGEAMNPRIPSSVVATAIQYLRRFYLSHSPMIYHPKPIMVCALYLATKADHFYMSLSTFVSELDKMTEEDVKAPEFLLLQALRFTLDVRHPLKGLLGGHAEMMAMVQEGRLGSNGPKATKFTAKRVESAADSAKGLLTRAAQMTDAYFLYTPSQIWLGAVMVADSELTQVYLEQKLNDLPFDDVTAATFKHRVLTTISACAKLLGSYHRSQEDSSAQRKELTRIRKKLDVCHDPEKVDIDAVVKIRAGRLSEKRDSYGSDAEKALKKRKVARSEVE